MIIELCSTSCISLCILPPLPAGTSLLTLYVCLSLRPCQKWVVSGLWHSLPSLVTSEFCQRGATVDTPFLTDLKTQTSPFERSVMMHIVLVLRFQSLGCEPCLRTSGLFCALPRFANQTLFSLFSLPEGRERSRRSSLSGRRLRFVVVGHFFRLETSYWFSEPSVVCLGSGPLNHLRLLRFLAYILFHPFWGTLGAEKPTSRSNTIFGA